MGNKTLDGQRGFLRRGGSSTGDHLTTTKCDTEWHTGHGESKRTVFVMCTYKMAAARVASSVLLCGQRALIDEMQLVVGSVRRCDDGRVDAHKLMRGFARDCK